MELSYFEVAVINLCLTIFSFNIYSTILLINFFIEERKLFASYIFLITNGLCLIYLADKLIQDQYIQRDSISILITLLSLLVFASFKKKLIDKIKYTIELSKKNRSEIERINLKCRTCELDTATEKARKMVADIERYSKRIGVTNELEGQ